MEMSILYYSLFHSITLIIIIIVMPGKISSHAGEDSCYIGRVKLATKCEKLEVYQPWANIVSCKNYYVKLAQEGTYNKPTALVSFTNSGLIWFIHMIELSSGIATGSILPNLPSSSTNSQMKCNTRLGDGRTIIQATHDTTYNLLPKWYRETLTYDGQEINWPFLSKTYFNYNGILLIRNPWHSLMNARHYILRGLRKCTQCSRQQSRTLSETRDLNEKVLQISCLKPENTEENPLRVTRNNSFVGTTQYVSPEISQGKYSQVGPPADLWALGCILFQFATGTPPFNGPNEYLVFRKILSLDYKFPTDFDPPMRDLIESLVELNFDSLCDQTPPPSSVSSYSPFSADVQFCSIIHHVPDTIEPGFDPRVIAARVFQDEGLETSDVNININLANAKTNEDLTNRNNKEITDIEIPEAELFRSPRPTSKIETHSSCCTCILI